MQRLKNNLRQILVGALIVIIILLMAEFNNRMSELDRLSEQRDRAAVQITSLMKTQAVLQTQITHATSVAAVEEWAYEDGRLVRPGDKPVVPLPEGGEVSPTPISISPGNKPVLIKNWEVWYALFFDRNEP
ncbi:MAG TPA: hypothetical protein VI451_16745 [Anaerolineales bacterium]|nr:hypothetical protein [Anaerolineales bacterium]